ncbi:hypothetical protein OSB04_un001170 [Centaurea solstitialis]|uniref:Uncharacterized protein n=1 Tax=Centaurea solstitialis TaxID=347529 RepID=A0AA38SM85_9ASTR|nr:hypothetical protein OSB04_un001170 [Centaurea solstitialis]
MHMVIRNRDKALIQGSTITNSIYGCRATEESPVPNLDMGFSDELNMFLQARHIGIRRNPFVLFSKRQQRRKLGLWPYRRFSHQNFYRYSTLANGGLVKGLPKVDIWIEILYVRCQMGKMKRKFSQVKDRIFVSNPPLEMLPQGLMRTDRIQSIMERNKSCYGAYIPQQNGVVERRTGTLVGSARTMLVTRITSLLFWAKACYILNNVSNHGKFDKKEPTRILFLVIR